jgi:TRAP-type mannitol/chloroaromatic compound transport system permease small subunit
MSDQTHAQRDPFPLRLLDSVTQTLNVAGSALILLLMLLVGIDVAGRNLAGNPISGVPELVTLSIVAIVFLQIPAALRQGRMTRSDALIDWLARSYPTLGKSLETVFDLIAIAIIWVIVHTTWPIFTRAWNRGEFVGAVGDFTAPVWPVKLILILGGAVLILQFAARIWRRYR